MAKTAPAFVSLESGDRLTREEFHRRYCARPDIKKAELIKGVVYVGSPVRFQVHGEQHGIIVLWLGTYAVRVPGVRMGDNATVLIAEDGEVQPDAFLFWEAGHARVNSDGYIEGAPELVVEVAASSVSYDLHDKKQVYQEAGVQEYIVWRVLDHAIDWFRLRDGVYVALQPDERGIITSEVFPGLRLAVDKLLAGDNAAVLATLNLPPTA